MANFKQATNESTESAKILEKLLESLASLVTHHKFYSLFSKNEGTRKLIQLHKSDTKNSIKLLITKVIITILKTYSINYLTSKFSNKKQISEFLDCITQEINENFVSYSQILHYLTSAGYMLLDIELTARYQEQLYFYLVPLLISTHGGSTSTFKSQFGFDKNADAVDPTKNEKLLFTTCTYTLYLLRFLYSLPTKRHYFRKVF